LWDMREILLFRATFVAKTGVIDVVARLVARLSTLPGSNRNIALRTKG
jgi:hypothetical protein